MYLLVGSFSICTWALNMHKYINHQVRFMPHISRSCILNTTFIVTILEMSVEDLMKYAVKDERTNRIHCTICRAFSHACSKMSVVDHIESKHFFGSMMHFCDICGQRCNTRNALKGHRKKCALKGRPDSSSPENAWYSGCILSERFYFLLPYYNITSACIFIENISS